MSRSLLLFTSLFLLSAIPCSNAQHWWNWLDIIQPHISPKFTPIPGKFFTHSPLVTGIPMEPNHVHINIPRLVGRRFLAAVLPSIPTWNSPCYEMACFSCLSLDPFVPSLSGFSFEFHFRKLDGIHIPDDLVTKQAHVPTVLNNEITRHFDSFLSHTDSLQLFQLISSSSLCWF